MRYKVILIHKLQDGGHVFDKNKQYDTQCINSQSLANYYFVNKKSLKYLMTAGMLIRDASLKWVQPHLDYIWLFMMAQQQVKILNLVITWHLVEGTSLATAAKTDL